MLDISIKNLDKIVTSEEKSKQLLDGVVEASVKYDGVKVTIFRNNKDFDPDFYQNNWVISYKNNIIFHTECANVDRDLIKSYSIGISQFALIHDHLKRVHKNCASIPKNTEFFVEFIMNKPTITRDYTVKHGLYLIASSPSIAEYYDNLLFTYPEAFDQSKNKEYADILDLKLPEVIFKGKIDSYQEFRDNILKTKSEIGDVIEGVVIKTTSGKYYKILQEDQHDKKKRYEKKQRYIESPEAEKEYWEYINNLAYDLIFKTDVTNEESLQNGYPFSILNSLCDKIYYNLIDVDVLTKNLKKHHLNIRDDLYLTAKSHFFNVYGDHNQNALFLGRFQPPTIAHFNIIKNFIEMCKGRLYYNKIVICIISGNKSKKELNPFPVSLIKEMIKKVFPDDNIEIMTHSTGNLISIINKYKFNIRYVLAGSDRSDDYAKQLRNTYTTNVLEYDRRDDDVSATKLRKAIKEDNFNDFKKLIHPELIGYYDQLKSLM